MGRLPQQSTLETRLAELERRMRVQETANRLRSSSVGEGGLRFYDGGSATFEDGGGVIIKDGAAWTVEGTGRGEFNSGGSILFRDHEGREYAYVGGMNTNGFGMILTRINGTQALAFIDDDPENEAVQRIRLLDSGGNRLVSEDRSGEGIDWPMVPFTTYSDDPSKWGAVTDAGFQSVAGAQHYRHSPKLFVRVKHYADAGTAGELRVMVNDVQLGGTAAVGSTITTSDFGPDLIAHVPHGQWTLVRAEMRRASGTGSVRGVITMCAGWGS